MIGKAAAVTRISLVRRYLVIFVICAIFMFCQSSDMMTDWSCLYLDLSWSGMALSGVVLCEIIYVQQSKRLQVAMVPDWLLDTQGCFSLSQMLL